MPAISRFSASRTSNIPSARKVPQETLFDFRGLDYSTPYDSIKNGRSPFAKNFRLYEDNEEDRRVAISTRKGSGLYTKVMNETANVSNVATTGAGVAPVDKITAWKAMPFTATSSGRLTKIELNVRTGTGRGPLIIEVYTNNVGLPGSKIADSSIKEGLITASFGYKPAYFIEAPEITSGSTYWIVAYVQDDGSGSYEFSTNTASALAKTSNGGLAGFFPTSYSINFKTYTTTSNLEKGMFRFNRENADNKTIIIYGTTMYAVDDTDGSFTSIATGLNASAEDYSFAVMDGKLFWVNGYDNLKAYNGTTVETITDTELPILSQIIIHNDRMMGVVANERNKMVYSENPGNPSDLPSNQQWYYQWLSVNFFYVPAPKVADPIIGMIPFQNVLKIFTTNGKYDLYGYDINTYELRQSLAKKGAVSSSLLADESYVYFVGKDGIYRHNGTRDDLISELISTVFNRIDFPENINIVEWNKGIRFYFGRPSAGFNTDCLIFDKQLEEWQHDTEVYANRGIVFTDADDDGRLVESSSLVPQIFQAEVDYDNLGKAIDFAYWTRYDSLGAPAQRKRMQKYFPLFEPVGRAFTINVDMDKDKSNTPVHNNVTLTVTGALWGEFDWGDGTIWGDTTQFKPKRLRFPGWAYYWQMRISRRAINNPVMFFGVQYSYKVKRL